MLTEPESVEFHYRSAFKDQAIPEAYERLLPRRIGRGRLPVYSQRSHRRSLADCRTSTRKDRPPCGPRPTRKALGGRKPPTTCYRSWGIAGNRYAAFMKAAMPELHISATTEEASQANARFVADLAQQCAADQGRFTIALSGGSTPRRLYQVLASPPYSKEMEWDRWHVFWSDGALRSAGPQ